MEVGKNQRMVVVYIELVVFVLCFEKEVFSYGNWVIVDILSCYEGEMS